MTVPRGARSGLLLCVLCWAGASLAAVAIAAPAGHRSARERSSHTARACRRHRAKHRHCRAARTGKKSHKRGSAAKPSVPGGVGGKGSSGASGSAGAPWTAAPAPVIPGAGSGSGSGSGPGSGSGGGSSGSAGAPPAETPGTPSGPAHVQITAEDSEAFRFVLSRPSVPAGQVVIEFVNHGQDEHNLNALEPGGEPTPGGSLPKTAPNAHPTLSLDLHAGSYTFFCSLPHHEEKGMKAVLKVE